jgi:hypothetical protein
LLKKVPNLPGSQYFSAVFERAIRWSALLKIKNPTLQRASDEWGRLILYLELDFRKKHAAHCQKLWLYNNSLKMQVRLGRNGLALESVSVSQLTNLR